MKEDEIKILIDNYFNEVIKICHEFKYSHETDSEDLFDILNKLNLIEINNRKKELRIFINNLEKIYERICELAGEHKNDTKF